MQTESDPSAAANATPGVTVQELDALIKTYSETRADAGKLSAQLTELNKIIMELETKITGFLKELGRKSYKSEFGNFIRTEKWSVKMPANDKDKQALFDWMKNEGIFDDYISVNYQSLNSLYKTFQEQAIERGDIAFSIPGLAPPTVHEGIQWRK